jgi:hypothetical protein
MRRLFAIALVVLALVAIFLLSRPVWSTPRCTTSQEKTLGRLQTLCADGTRAVSTWSRTLERWDTIITPAPAAAKPKIYLHPKAPRP